jgi:hypothetical protein
VLLTLTACSGDGDTGERPLSDPAESSTPATSRTTTATPTPETTGLPTEVLSGDEILSLALLLVPADAEVVVFTDVAAVEQRLGYAGLSGQSPASEGFAFWEAARADGAMLTGARLYDYSSLMSIDYGWTAEDVDWEVAWSEQPEACTSPEDCGADGGGYVLGLRRDLDWNLVLNSLADNGFVESGEAPGVFVTDDPSAPFETVRLIPEIHGLAVGAAALPDGDGESPHSIAEELAPVANRLGQPESAYLRSGCVALETALGPDATEDDVTEYFKHNDPSDLEPPLSTAVAVNGRSSATVVLRYATMDAAEKDATQREQIINGWPSRQTGRPFASAGTAQVSVEEGYGHVDIAVDDLPLLARMVLTDDAPWALCPATPPPK